MLPNLNEWTVFDLITLISFQVALENLKENQNQSDSQKEILNRLDNKLDNQDEHYLKLLVETNYEIINQNKQIIEMLERR